MCPRLNPSVCLKEGSAQSWAPVLVTVPQAAQPPCWKKAACMLWKQTNGYVWSSKCQNWVKSRGWNNDFSASDLSLVKLNCVWLCLTCTRALCNSASIFTLCISAGHYFLFSSRFKKPFPPLLVRDLNLKRHFHWMTAWWQGWWYTV